MPLPALPIRMGSVLTEKELNAGALNTSAPEADISTTDLPTANASTANASTADANRSQRAASARPATPPPVSAETAPAETTPAVSVPASAAPAAQNCSARAKPARLPAARRKLFVLDTNVLLHDPSSLFRFEAHDVFLPMVVLEELDHLKKGMSELARNARQASRFMDHLVNSQAVPGQGLAQGVVLDGLGHTDARGHLHFQHTALKSDLPVELPAGKADNLILQVVHALAAQHPKRDVVLVSKDINMRLKALSLGLRAEDYFNDHVIDDSDLLYEGVLPLPDNFWHKHGKDVESWQEGGITWYRIKGPLCSDFIVNEFVYFEGELPLYAQVKEVNGKSAVLATLRDHSHAKNSVWGVTARNREQNFALNLLMNPVCDFVSLLGQAGTGKTLLALAAGLAQTFETKRYNEIIITRATVPVGDDIGFLPGTEEEKMLPWMGALEDNLEVLHAGQSTVQAGGAVSAGHHNGGQDWSKSTALDLIRSRIKVKSLNFMRGRTFQHKYLIIDEAQNLTPKQMKTLVTRAGPGTKIVCLGNIAQIDTPYLTEASSGLTWVVDRFKGWPHAGHITLQRGERSRLADYASEAL